MLQNNGHTHRWSRGRWLGDVGSTCAQTFDCWGIMTCCQGLGPGGMGRCYTRCDRQRTESCGPTVRCAQGLKCCNSNCIAEQETCHSNFRPQTVNVDQLISGEVTQQTPSSAEENSQENSSAQASGRSKALAGTISSTEGLSPQQATANFE